MWRIFSKKNRNYTIGGVVAFVVIVFVIYKYVLKDTAIGKWFKGALDDPATVVSSGLGSATWEEESYRGRGPISIAEGGTGRSPKEAIALDV